MNSQLPMCIEMPEMQYGFVQEFTKMWNTLLRG